ncbi:hypothetical protein QYE76_039212 [Lolium multiflorum]|uniref:CCHC-type domain-containing protein n=1 Tax=Lolium multiflorum TaxID=4521 RepID=A0AAD8WRZ1_LOLMU|nr:hypothetical protein QYE76_039212 [Lolium multiflorum]
MTGSHHGEQPRSCGSRRPQYVCHPLLVRTCQSLVDKCPCNECGQMMTWEDFKLKFSKYHVPQGLIKKMRDEFRELKQGRMSVVEYRDSFSLCQDLSPQLHQQQRRTPKPGGNNNNNSHHNNNNHNSNSNNGNNTNTNTSPRTGSNAIPVTPKDKSTINCYECGVVGHFSNECPKKLARIAANTAAPAQQQRRFAGRRNQNNNNGRLYHMTATEAQEAPQTMPKITCPISRPYPSLATVPLPSLPSLPAPPPSMASAAVAVAAAAAFLREGRMPPRSTHPRHQQHKPLRRGGGGAGAASRWRSRRRVKVEEPPRPPPLPSSSVSSSTTLQIVGELPPLPSLFLPRASTTCSTKCSLGWLWMHCC